MDAEVALRALRNPVRPTLADAAGCARRHIAAELRLIDALTKPDPDPVRLRLCY